MSQGRLLEYLQKRHTLSVLLLGFSSGLPLLLTLSTLQYWFTEAKIDVKAVGALSLVTLPYSWKFLWSPLLDRFKAPFWGKRRGWIALMQLALAASLFMIAQLNPASLPKTVALIGVIIAFFSATQDICIDAYRTEILAPKERGIGASFAVSGYRIAMLISGGIALMLAGQFGWHVMFRVMGVIMLICVLFSWYAPEPHEATRELRTLKTAVIEPFKDFMSRKYAIIILIFIVLYKLGDDFAQALLSVFFFRYLQFSLTEIGAIYKFGGFAATIGGALIGGYFVSKIGLYKSLMRFGIFQLFSTLAFLALVIFGKNYGLFVFSIVVENLSAGMGTAAFAAFLMSLCNHRYTATQYALFSALFSVGRVFVGPIAGQMVANMGWGNYFLWSFFMGLPGLFCLWIMGRRINFDALQLS